MRTNVFIAEQILDAATCRIVQAAMDAGVAEPGEILDEESIALAEDVRRAMHIEVPPAILDVVERCLDEQRETLAAFFDLPPLTREGVSLLRYETGGFYKRHIDRAEMPSWPAAADRLLTLVVFLNDSRDANAAGSFGGGVLRLYLDGDDRAPVEIVPARGRLVAFPSDTPHEVTPVTHGRRDTIVDWLS